MVKKPVKNYAHDKKKSRKKPVVLSILSLVLILCGAYLLLLTFSPSIEVIPSGNELNTSDDKKDKRNRVQIEEIDLEVPYFEGDASVLEKGAWHRFPERGDPEEGGNFILSAHRFYLGLTPQGTRKRSPFYRLEELRVGDKIRTFFDNKWYDYKVTRTYQVEPDDIYIEEPTDEHIMTLYTCTLAGSADGRVVIEARPDSL